MEPRRRFRFLKQLSEGTFGRVYMAEMITDNNFSSVVAIKLLHGKWLGHEEIVQRSRDEARVLGLLHHRNIIRVEDLTSINGQCAIIMEFLNGVDLKTLITYCAKTGTPLPRKVTFELIAATASALEAAYDRPPLRGGEPLRLIHRDIKPSNIMLTKEGDIKVLDFGTAQARFEDREAKTQALAFGSQAYMAPERLLGDPDAPSGDVFSLGVTLYELLALESYGKIHIRPERFDDALRERVETMPLEDLSGDVAAKVREAVLKMLGYEAQERPDAGLVLDLMEDLSEMVNDGSLRRFCRDVVRPLVEARREHQNARNDHHDPLEGSTLFEDVNSFTELLDAENPGGVVKEAPSPRANSTLTFNDLDEGEGENEGEDVSGGTAVPEALHTEPVSEPVDLSPTVADAPVADAPVADEPPGGVLDTPPGGSSMLRRPPPPPPGKLTQTVQPSIGTVSPASDRKHRTPQPEPTTANSSSGGLRWLMLVAAATFIVVLGGGGGLALVASGAFNDDPDPVVINEPDPVPAFVSVGRDGGVVQVGPESEDAGTVILTLRGGQANVTINSIGGAYKEEWNGSGSLELVGLPAGLYRAKIEGPDDSQRTTFDALAGQTCTFTYALDQGADEWESSCE
ncbi:MAG: serine/threonine-protein kinase [Myxococcota bacterium]